PTGRKGERGKKQQPIPGANNTPSARDGPEKSPPTGRKGERGKKQRPIPGAGNTPSARDGPE
ncbi:MAG: hypothetical protein ACLU9L_10365, partial [Christensenellales bacterium]